MEAAAAAREGLTEAPQPTRGERQREAVKEAASVPGAKLDAQVVMDASEWFTETADEDVSHPIKLNVGGPVDEDGNVVNDAKPPIWVTWVVAPLDLDTIKAIRKRSVSHARKGRRGAAGGAGEFDDTLFNLGVVVEATIEPDLQSLAQRAGHADPRNAVKERFRNKSGLIGQIVGEVLDLSGYNENDVQDGDAAVSAAGNSPE